MGAALATLGSSTDLIGGKSVHFCKKVRIAFAIGYHPSLALRWTRLKALASQILSSLPQLQFRYRRTEFSFRSVTKRRFSSRSLGLLQVKKNCCARKVCNRLDVDPLGLG